MKRMIISSTSNELTKWLKYYNSLPIERAADNEGMNPEDYIEERNEIAKPYGYVFRGYLSGMVKYYDALDDMTDLMWWEDKSGNKIVGYEVGDKIYKADFSDVIEKVIR